jgi:co-chaperonin GroES (HSP10)
MIAIGKNIIIDTIEEEIKTNSGIILSAEDANSMRYKRGCVVAPGHEVNVIKEGDEIFYDKSHSYTMVINEKQYTIIQERDVVVVSSPRLGA